MANGPGRPVEPEASGAAVTPGSMRVGDTERNSALEALGEHLTAGRISLDEYGDRSAKVTVARTADDLTALFDDLPAPYPVLPVPGTAGPGGPAVAGPLGQVVTSGPGQVPVRPNGDTRSTAQKLVGAAAAASVFVAVALFFVTGQWWWFLLIPAISAVAGSIWGPDWKEPRPALGQREPRRELRNQRRELRDENRQGRRYREIDDH